MTDREWAKELINEGYSLDEILESYVQAKQEQRIKSEISLANLAIEPIFIVQE